MCASSGPLTPSALKSTSRKTEGATMEGCLVPRVAEASRTVTIQAKFQLWLKESLGQAQTKSIPQKKDENVFLVKDGKSS